MLELQVINLWGGPGAGKSTTAAGLFNLLKQVPGLRVELVTEFAKDLTYERNLVGLQNQLYILGHQDHRLRRLEGKVDFVITDSPLPLGIAYLTPEYQEMDLDETILDAYARYTNYDFLLRRKKPYATYGRNQTEHEALTIDADLMHIFRRATGWNGDLVDLEHEAFVTDADEFAPFSIAQYLPIPNLEKLLA